VWQVVSPLNQFDEQLQELIRELTLRIVALRSPEFDRVCETANRVCDRYGLGDGLRDL
jgi:hypothetical protein